MSKYNIVTEDRTTKDLIIGNLVVNDLDTLKKIRDFLIKDIKANYELKHDEKIQLDYNIKSGWSSEGDKLVKKYNLKRTDDIIEYKRKIYTSKNINSVLILTSLLQELNPINYNKLAKEFIKHGIFRCERLEDIWPICSNGLLEQAKNGNEQDLEIFREILQQKIIEYQISQKYSIEEIRDKNILKTLKLSTNQIATNNELLGLHPRR